MLTQPWQLKLTWHEHVACHICLRIVLIQHENLKDLYDLFNTSGTKVEGHIWLFCLYNNKKKKKEFEK